MKPYTRYKVFRRCGMIRAFRSEARAVAFARLSGADFVERWYNSAELGWGIARAVIWTR